MQDFIKAIKYRFIKTNVYSADLLLSIALILLAFVLYQFSPASEPNLSVVYSLIDGNQRYISTFLLVVGLLQLWHVNSTSERRKIVRLFHTLTLLISFGIWLSFTVISMRNQYSLPISTSAFGALTLTNLWVFVRYGCR